MSKIIYPTILVLSLVACSHKVPEKEVSRKGIAQEGFEGSHYTALQFERGRSILTTENKNILNELAKKASRTGREIEEIKILAWADREYSNDKNKVKTRDVILANERASVIRDFMKKDLSASNEIDIFNMAKKPGPIDQLVKNEEYRIKEDIAGSGVSSTRLPSGEVSYTKAGKVVVIIDYK